MDRHGDGRRTTTGRGLLWLAALAAAVAAVGSAATTADTGDGTVVVETWRTVGLATFAGLFAVLALRPGVHVAVWLAVGANKLALGLAGLLVLAGAEGGAPEGAVDLVVFDGALAALLLAAFVLVRPARVARRPGAGAA